MTEGLMQPIVCPVLIGRTSYLDFLRHLIDEAHIGGNQVMLIAGEAGVGKSRLVAEVQAYAVAKGLPVLHAACFPQDSASPYAPLLDLLRARFANYEPTAIAAEVGPFARDLSPLLPDLLPVGAEVSPLAKLDSKQEQQRLFAALAHCLTRQDAQAPMVLIIEDLHWCDEGSLDVLLYLLRRAANQPLLLIGTYRSDNVGPHLRRWLAHLDRERLLQEIALPPLTPDEVAAMVRAIFGAGCPVRAALLDPIYALSEGNPFYVEELLKALVAAGDIFYADGTWDCKPIQELQIPRSLQDAVQQRVVQLSAAARGVLILAAVIGRRFPFALLQHLAGSDERELLHWIKELIAAQLVVEASTEQFAFRHALTQQVIYSQLLARERVALHRTVAEALERVYDSALDAHLDDLAYHWYQAHAWDKALAYAHRAGERAQRLYAPHAAVEQFTRALEAAQQLAQPSHTSNTARSSLAPASMYRQRGRAYETLGEFEQAHADYEAALASAQTTGDRQVEWQALLDLGLLWAGRDYEEAGGYYERALNLARTLDDAVMLAHSLNRVGNWHVNVARPQEALQFHREAFTIFERLHHRRGIAETLDLLGMASYNSADLHASAAYYQRAIALFRELNDRRGLISSLAMLMARGSTYAIQSMEADAASFAAALRDGDLALQEARAIDWRAGEAFALFQLGLLLGPQGEYARALELSQCALQIAEEIGHHQWMAGAHWTLGALYLDLLALPQAQEHLERALALGQAIHSPLWTHFALGSLALMYLAGRDLDQAHTILEAAFDPQTPVQSVGQWLLMYAHVQLALARGDPARALNLLNRVSAPVVQGIGTRDTPRLATARGEALAALSQTAEAERVLRRVQDVTRTQGARPQLWRTQVVLGNLYAAHHRDEEAARTYTAAQTLIEELAADMPDASARNAFVRNATALLPRRYYLSPRRIEAAQFEGLTAREREVAALIAQGKTNREIAAALVIGERTVETHVSHILAKLDATSRQEIAAWAVDKGLTHNE